MNVPDGLRYTSDHEWARLEDGKVRVGITDYAQDALGDVVFVQLPEQVLHGMEHRRCVRLDRDAVGGVEMREVQGGHSGD